MHPIVSEAAEGCLPAWACAGAARRAHMDRVSELLGEWSATLGLPESERARWRAGAYLHDALRDEAPESLRSRVPPDLRGLPDPLVHGPAAAERMRIEGIDDGELLLAVAFHTMGDARFGCLGRALYAADFLEPGRSFLPEWRAELRARMPAERNEVVFQIVRARIGNLLDRGETVQPRTWEFWNALVAERS